MFLKKKTTKKEVVKKCNFKEKLLLKVDNLGPTVTKSELISLINNI